jgi:hypothetical protein
MAATCIGRTWLGRGMRPAKGCLSASEIRAAIMEARDLAKKGSARRQREYAERTAYKALRQAG